MFSLWALMPRSLKGACVQHKFLRMPCKNGPERVKRHVGIASVDGIGIRDARGLATARVKGG